MFVPNKTLLYPSMFKLFPKEVASAYGLKTADLESLCHHFFLKPLGGTAVYDFALPKKFFQVYYRRHYQSIRGTMLSNIFAILDMAVKEV